MHDEFRARVEPGEIASSRSFTVDGSGETRSIVHIHSPDLTEDDRRREHQPLIRTNTCPRLSSLFSPFHPLRYHVWPPT